jgi:hypothetical protein
MIFDVSDSAPPPKAEAPPPLEAEPGEPGEPEETRMLDLRDLMRLTQRSLAPPPPPPPLDDVNEALSVREAILLVDSIAPLALDPEPRAVAEALPAPREAPPSPTSPSPAQRRLRAVCSGLTVLVVMASLVAIKGRMARDEAAAAGLLADHVQPAARVPATPEPPSEEALKGEPPPSAVPAAPAAPAAPKAAPRKVPVRPAPPRRPAPAPAPAPVDTGLNHAEVAPEATPHVDLMEAMTAAVAAHATPSSAPKVDCPPTPANGSGTLPSPCARAGTRTLPPPP